MAAMWETWVQSLGWEDPLEEVMAIHSSILAWRIPMGRGVWQATVHGVTKSWTQLSDVPDDDLSFSPLPFASLFFSAIYKASSDNLLPFCIFFFLKMVMITPSCTMS